MNKFIRRIARLRFSIRTMLLLVALIALGIAGWNFFYPSFARWWYTYPGSRYDVRNDPKITGIVVPVGTTDLEVGNCSQLRTLSIPEGVTTMRIHDCKKLTKIRLPATAVKVSISSMDLAVLDSLPDGIEQLSLYSCTNVEGVRIPSSVNLFAAKFSDARRISVPAGTTEVTVSESASLMQLDLPDSVETLSINGTPLTQIRLPKNLKRFYCSGCTQLEEVRVPRNLERFEHKGCPGLKIIYLD